MSATRASKKSGRGDRNVSKEAGENKDKKDTDENKDNKDTDDNKDNKDTDDNKDIDSYTVLRVHKFDPGTEAARHKRLIQVENTEFATTEKGTLKDLRLFLITQQVFESQDKASPFCDPNGSELSDSTKTKIYLTLVGDDTKDKPQSEATPCRQISLYYKQKKTRNAIDDETKEFLRSQLDLKTKDEGLSEADVKRLKSAFDSAAWMANGGSKLSHAADLNEKQWSIIVRTNCLLSGYTIVKHDKIVGGPMPPNPDPLGYDKKSSKSKIRGQVVTDYKIERTPYSAFQLKKRQFQVYEISADYGQEVLSSQTPTQPGAENLMFRIPRFRVDDDSYVSVFETQNALEKSLAKGSFSESSVEASAGGGFWGVSAGAKFGGAWNSSDDSVHSESSESKSMNVTYKFPRITLYLDPNSLEITPECKADIDKVNDKKSLLAFSEKYGDIFARRVQLGGSLFASENSTATTVQDKAKHANSLKVSAAASISSSYFQASASGSHGEGSNSNSSDTKQDLTSAMAWEAIGGDTLLCNNPAQWCATVGDFYNWRVIDQDSVRPLSEALDEFAGDGAITQRFKEAAKK
ncbi:hypothetical protein P168DRAFT_330340 [Aspergillus campestris IBT 28561]|uniref:MACPF-like domain-containing protein n=1 Tax=Aspergillus campestris (strain IBT 28561) TaxID=1392248 RepID=A0A2I1CSC5_ASPC2|nr:uncharacterized protein P168DRAFT_330340 [Aspergillus campestris IBT 28561]PKY00522.1 hypothetical protein P168DRAFT_330340 [Aspergillus campestris IBT 28561]